MDVVITSKITLKEVGLDVTALENFVENESGSVLRVLGKIVTYSVKPNSINPEQKSIKFSGMFEATNLVTGEVFKSSSLYLPDVASFILMEQYDEAKKDELSGSVGFALDIVAKPNKSAKPNASKYKFDCIPLIATTPEGDSLADVRAQLKLLPENV